MSYELRRFTVSECLGKAFNILFDEFWIFLSIGLLLGLASFGIQYSLAVVAKKFTLGLTNTTLTTFLVSGISSLGLVFLGDLFRGLVSRIVANRYMDKTGTWGEILKTLARLPSLIIASLIVSLTIFVGMVLLVVPGVIFSLGFAFTSMIIVVEELGPIESMKRSWALTKGKRLSLLGLGILTGLISSGVNTGFGWLFGVLWPAAPGGSLGFLRAMIGTTIPYMIVGSYTAAVTVIFYLGIRASEEGLEAERIAETFGSVPDSSEFLLGDEATEPKE